MQVFEAVEDSKDLEEGEVAELEERLGTWSHSL